MVINGAKFDALTCSSFRGFETDRHRNRIALDMLGIGLCYWRVKDFKVLKYFVNILVLFLIEKCVVKYLWKANLLLAVKLQSELITGAIL